MSKIKFLGVLVMLLLFCPEIFAQQTFSGKFTVWTIGDSTMANKKAEVAPEKAGARHSRILCQTKLRLKNGQ